MCGFLPDIFGPRGRMCYFVELWLAMYIILGKTIFIYFEVKYHNTIIPTVIVIDCGDIGIPCNPNTAKYPVLYRVVKGLNGNSYHYSCMQARGTRPTREAKRLASCCARVKLLQGDVHTRTCTVDSTCTKGQQISSLDRRVYKRIVQPSECAHQFPNVPILPQYPFHLLLKMISDSWRLHSDHGSGTRIRHAILIGICGIIITAASILKKPVLLYIHWERCTVKFMDLGDSLSQFQHRGNPSKPY